jgi:hypothetical protein
VFDPSHGSERPAAQNWVELNNRTVICIYLFSHAAVAILAAEAACSAWSASVTSLFFVWSSVLRHQNSGTRPMVE